jgi:poly-gamma-glutamate synthesis protein (capsule biosynthesis protein)
VRAGAVKACRSAGCDGIRGHEEFRGDLALLYFPAIDSETGRLRSLELLAYQSRALRLRRATMADANWLAEILTRHGRALGTAVSCGSNGVLNLA